MDNLASVHADTDLDTFLSELTVLQQTSQERQSCLARLMEELSHEEDVLREAQRQSFIVRRESKELQLRQLQRQEEHALREQFIHQEYPVQLFHLHRTLSALQQKKKDLETRAAHVQTLEKTLASYQQATEGEGGADTNTVHSVGQVFRVLHMMPQLQAQYFGTTKQLLQTIFSQYGTNESAEKITEGEANHSFKMHVIDRALCGSATSPGPLTDTERFCLQQLLEI